MIIRSFEELEIGKVYFYDITDCYGFLVRSKQPSKVIRKSNLQEFNEHWKDHPDYVHTPVGASGFYYEVQTD